MTPEAKAALRRAMAAATQGTRQSMRDGNQYINTGYIPTATLVGASIVTGLKRPWNPHAAISFGLKSTDHEIVRFTDADADFIALCDPQTIGWLLDNQRTPGTVEICSRCRETSKGRQAVLGDDDSYAPSWAECQQQRCPIRAQQAKE